MRWWPFQRRSQGEIRSDDWKTAAVVLGGLGLVGSEAPISHATVYSCINVIAEGVAMLPASLRQRGSNGTSTAAVGHPVDTVLGSPCPHMTAFGFWKLVMIEKLNHGNHYSLVLRDKAAGGVTELYPIERGRVVPFWYRPSPDALPRRAYRVSMPDGGAQAIFMEDEIFHVANLSPLGGAQYGLQGFSVWDLYQAETIKAAISTEKFAGAYWDNGASLSGMIGTDAPLKPAQMDELREAVTKAYAGVGNAHKLGVFGHGSKFYAMSTDAQKAQMIETRKYNRSVIAGILRVSAHLINDLEKATFSNIEQLDIGHYKHCLLPHLVDLRQTIEKDLLTPAERRLLYVDHDPTEMLRGDMKTWAEVLEKGVQNGRLKPNEARALDGRGPEAGGDRLYINAATVLLEQAGQQKDANPKEPPNDPAAA